MKKNIFNWFMLAALLTVSLTMNAQNGKAKGAVQRKQFFDDNWKFFLGDSPKASNVDFDDTSWRSLDLPHDWSIEGTMDTNNPMGNDGGYFPRRNWLVS